MAKMPYYSMIGFRLSFVRFYRTVPMHCIEGQYVMTLPSGYFAASLNGDDAVKFVNAYWKSRVN